MNGQRGLLLGVVEIRGQRERGGGIIRFAIVSTNRGIMKTIKMLILKIKMDLYTLPIIIYFIKASHLFTGIKCSVDLNNQIRQQNIKST